MTQNSPQVKTTQRERLHAKSHAFGELAEKCSGIYLAATESGAGLSASLEAGMAMQELRQAFDQDMLSMVTPLMNTHIGFMTDRAPGAKKRDGSSLAPYSSQVLTDCCLEAALKGLQFVGNQFNIISGRCYVAKAGYEYLIKRKVEGFEWWRHEVGVPASKNGGALVECSAEWCIKGRTDSLKCTIPVKTDAYSTADQIIGKAQRKLYKRVYEQMTGCVIFEPDEPEATIVENEAPQETPNADRKAPESGRPAAKPTGPGAGAQGQDDKRPGDGVPAGERQELGGDKGRPGGIPENFGRTDPQVGHPRH